MMGFNFYSWILLNIEESEKDFILCNWVDQLTLLGVEQPEKRNCGGKKGNMILKPTDITTHWGSLSAWFHLTYYGLCSAGCTGKQGLVFQKCLLLLTACPLSAAWRIPLERMPRKFLCANYCVMLEMRVICASLRWWHRWSSRIRKWSGILEGGGKMMVIRIL